MTLAVGGKGREGKGREGKGRDGKGRAQPHSWHGSMGILKPLMLCVNLWGKTEFGRNLVCVSGNGEAISRLIEGKFEGLLFSDAW